MSGPKQRTTTLAGLVRTADHAAFCIWQPVALKQREEDQDGSAGDVQIGTNTRGAVVEEA
jgi:hypothetical protein